jgi:hypothetical protein
MIILEGKSVLFLENEVLIYHFLDAEH